ncbi:MAG: flagellar biosynthetic protein FliR [Burkholderiales bacterium]|jgi:flagellar biosynthetic protein FliR|nr:flagellar biosynthetic protein FliR [Nitrosomonadaceae bacterium]
MITLTLGQFDALLVQYFYPFVRILALIASAPVLGNRAIPARIKVALAALIAFLIADTPGASLPAVDSYSGFVIVAREILIGLALGLSVRVIFSAIEMSGELIGLQMGLSFAGYIDPSSGGASNAVSSYLRVIAILLFLSINGHLLMIAGLSASFERYPIGAPFTSSFELSAVAAMGSQMFSLALSLALPIVIVLLMINLAMGIMSRVAPQLSIFAVGFPITMVAGLTTLTLLMPYLGRPLQIALERAASLILPT